jgi:hypothetical protein
MHVCPTSRTINSHLQDIRQHCAQTLLEFNGGASCVQVYVNQHDFFINRVRETKLSDDTSLYAHRNIQTISELLTIPRTDGIHYRILMPLPREPSRVFSNSFPISE